MPADTTKRKCKRHHFHGPAYSSTEPRVCCNCGKSRPSTWLTGFGNHAKPVTQKARGVQALGELAGIGYGPGYATLIQDKDDIKDALKALQTIGSQKLFARPCPLTPRPGFVDSRLVATEEDIKKVWKEAKQAEKTAELMLMPYMEATCSAVLTPGLIAVGPGHDGATAGKDSVAFPLLSHIPDEMQDLCKASHVDTATHDPHMEVVYRTNLQACVVQLRSGPKLPAGMGADYIPTPTAVLHVVAPMDDLLEWEAAVKKFKPNTVVYAPGFTLASHAALHCIAAGVPFVTSFKPEVGTVLKPTVSEKDSWSLEAIREGLGVAAILHIDVDKQAKQLVNVIFYGLHQAAAFKGDEAFWIGLAAGLMERFGMAAALGEWRHRPTDGCSAEDKADESKHCLREQIYKDVLAGPPSTKGGAAMASHWFTKRKQIREVAEGYFVRPWGGAFGGVKWGQCTWTLFELDAAIQEVLQAKADKSSIYRLLNAVNVAVNQAHNGGFWLGKFGGTAADADSAGKGGWLGIIHAIPAMWRISKQRPETAEAAAHAAKAWAVLGKMRPPQFAVEEGKLVVKTSVFGGHTIQTVTFKLHGYGVVKQVNPTVNLGLRDGIYPVVGKTVRFPGRVQLRLFVQLADGTTQPTRKCINFQVVRLAGTVKALDVKPIKENHV